jgi:hypothetical protein
MRHFFTFTFHFLGHCNTNGKEEKPMEEIIKAIRENRGELQTTMYSVNGIDIEVVKRVPVNHDEE